MIRRILCVPCAERTKIPNVQDAANGWQRRRLAIEGAKPQEHGLTINGVFHPLSSLRCDSCGKDMAEGTPLIAETHWRPEREPEPHQWELEYGSQINC